MFALIAFSRFCINTAIRGYYLGNTQTFGTRNKEYFSLVHSCCVRKYSPIELAGSVTKSAAYFRHARWKGRRQCPRCGYRLLYHLKDKRFGCRRCKYKFGEFTGTYIGEFNFSLDKLVHLLYYSL